MDRASILEQYDRLVREHPSEEMGYRTERWDGLVVCWGAMNWVSHCRLPVGDLEGFVRRATERFRARREEIEWKVYGHDGGPGLRPWLAQSGYRTEEEETLMVLDTTTPLAVGPTDPRIHVERIVDESGLREVVGVTARAFAPDTGWDFSEYARRLVDPTFEVYAARSEGIVVSAGRMDLPKGGAFASLWGGGTLPEYRGRGAYRALVAARVERARARGFRYATVDARDTSRPILQRLGFEPLTTMAGWILPKDPEGSPS